MKFSAIQLATASVILGWMCAAVALVADSAQEKAIKAIDDGQIVLSPYVWKHTGQGPSARAEAMMPGAYVKATFQGSASLGLVIDGSANQGCPAVSMPVVEASVDEGPFRSFELTETERVYTLPLAVGLDRALPHRVEIVFRAADLTLKRWTASTTHLRLAGLALDAGGSLLPSVIRPKRAIGFGDSIVEGVGADGLFTSWQLLGVNNARATWFPLVCAGLDCEYGQLGTGGQGMTRAIHLPPLTETWDRHDATTSRLTDGRLLPEPDYIFCGMGTNDYDKDITPNYLRWLTAMRKACPTARFFCIVPPLGVHQSEVQAAVSAANKSGDSRVYVIDTARLKAGFRAGQGATQFGYDGVHPSQYGHAMLSTLITAEVQRAIGAGE